MFFSISVALSFMENYSLKEVFGDTCQINGIVGNKSHYFSSNVVI